MNDNQSHSGNLSLTYSNPGSSEAPKVEGTISLDEECSVEVFKEGEGVQGLNYNSSNEAVEGGNTEGVNDHLKTCRSDSFEGSDQSLDFVPPTESASNLDKPDIICDDGAKSSSREFLPVASPGRDSLKGGIAWSGEEEEISPNSPYEKDRSLQDEGAIEVASISMESEHPKSNLDFDPKSVNENKVDECTSDDITRESLEEIDSSNLEAKHSSEADDEWIGNAEIDTGDIAGKAEPIVESETNMEAFGSVDHPTLDNCGLSPSEKSFSQEEQTVQEEIPRDNLEDSANTRILNAEFGGEGSGQGVRSNMELFDLLNPDPIEAETWFEVALELEPSIALSPEKQHSQEGEKYMETVPKEDLKETPGPKPLETTISLDVRLEDSEMNADDNAEALRSMNSLNIDTVGVLTASLSGKKGELEVSNSQGETRLLESPSFLSLSERGKSVVKKNPNETGDVEWDDANAWGGDNEMGVLDAFEFEQNVDTLGTEELEANAEVSTEHVVSTILGTVEWQKDVREGSDYRTESGLPLSNSEHSDVEKSNLLEEIHTTSNSADLAESVFETSQVVSDVKSEATDDRKPVGHVEPASTYLAEDASRSDSHSTEPVDAWDSSMNLAESKSPENIEHSSNADILDEGTGSIKPRDTVLAEQHPVESISQKSDSIFQNSVEQGVSERLVFDDEKTLKRNIEDHKEEEEDAEDSLDTGGWGDEWGCDVELPVGETEAEKLTPVFESTKPLSADFDGSNALNLTKSEDTQLNDELKLSADPKAASDHPGSNDINIGGILKKSSKNDKTD